MTIDPPTLTQFRLETQDNGLVHFVFDCPGRSMNVFSNKAIHELGQFSEWLHRADHVKGVILRSGKSNGFCAGADLTELGVAYEMIVAAPPADRFDIAFNHFFPLSHAIRRLETAGKPVAAAMGGLALGAGCELTMGAHYRVLTNSSRALLGLPEHAVGLLPGGGGTQRMARLVGLEAGLDALLEGRSFAGRAAIDAGLAHEVVAEGEEVAAAERWLLSDASHSTQPWDRADHAPLSHNAIAGSVERRRDQELRRMLGHEPAPLAILDCVELGLVQPVDGAIRTEMSIFAGLIQRIEPRNMIRTMFLGKQAFDKAAKASAVPESVRQAVADAAIAIDQAPDLLRQAGFRPQGAPVPPVQQRAGKGYWYETRPDATAAMLTLAAQIEPIASRLSAEELLMADHLSARERVIPAYLGGLSGLTALGQRRP